MLPGRKPFSGVHRAAHRAVPRVAHRPGRRTPFGPRGQSRYPAQLCGKDRAAYRCGTADLPGRAET